MLLRPSSDVTGIDMDFSLRFEDNETGLGDLVLTLGAESWLCDTYYLALDQQILPEQNGVHKIRLVLKHLLQQWLSVVEGLHDGGIGFLPYDFSDQYTVWVRCIRHGDTVEVCRGWAAVEGWSVSPSELGSYMSDLPGFRCDGDIHQVDYDEVKYAVNYLLKQWT
jgi:hypothetical protein